MNLLSRLALQVRFKIWAPWRTKHFNSFYYSHSQFGEDMVLRYLMGDAREGFFVDLGAHHPIFLSNTYHFYCKGWRGLCIDAEEGAINLFRLLRPHDISVVACLSPKSDQQACLHVFDQPAVNTLDEVVAAEIIRSGGAKLLEKRAVATDTLAGLLDTYLPLGTRVDFLTIDIEGIDEAVILGHDWSKFHPRAIVFESHDTPWEQVSELRSVRHLQLFGYTIEAKLGHSIVMVG